MSSLFDRMRSGAGKAAFEADKLRRVTMLQSELRGLRDEMQEAVEMIGRVALDLHQRGQIGPPELRAACETAVAVLAQLEGKQREIEGVREETYATTEEGPALACPVGHGPLPVGAHFCQQCGQPGVASAPPAVARPPGAVCATCGGALEAEATFCPSCGQRRAPQPDSGPRRQPAAGQPDTVRLSGGPAPGLNCPSCGTPAPNAETPYCPTCGFPYKRAA